MSELDWTLHSTIFNDTSDVPSYAELMNSISCSAEYALKQNENEGENMLCIIYTPSADDTASTLFHWQHESSGSDCLLRRLPIYFRKTVS